MHQKEKTSLILSPKRGYLKIKMMKKIAILWAFLFFLAGIAVEGPACASFWNGQKTCCSPTCPMKMLPKVGNSCCKQGVEKGDLAVAVLTSFEKPIASFMTIYLKQEIESFYLLPPVSSFQAKKNHIYLYEEHLLI